MSFFRHRLATMQPLPAPPGIIDPVTHDALLTAADLVIRRYILEVMEQILPPPVLAGDPTRASPSRGNPSLLHTIDTRGVPGFGRLLPTYGRSMVRAPTEHYPSPPSGRRWPGFLERARLGTILWLRSLARPHRWAVPAGTLASPPTAVLGQPRLPAPGTADAYRDQG